MVRSLNSSPEDVVFSLTALRADDTVHEGMGNKSWLGSLARFCIFSGFAGMVLFIIGGRWPAPKLFLPLVAVGFILAFIDTMRLQGSNQSDLENLRYELPLSLLENLPVDSRGRSKVEIDFSNQSQPVLCWLDLTLPLRGGQQLHIQVERNSSQKKYFRKRRRDGYGYGTETTDFDRLTMVMSEVKSWSPQEIQEAIAKLSDVHGWKNVTLEVGLGRLRLQADTPSITYTKHYGVATTRFDLKTYLAWVQGAMDLILPASLATTGAAETATETAALPSVEVEETQSFFEVSSG